MVCRQRRHQVLGCAPSLPCLPVPCARAPLLTRLLLAATRSDAECGCSDCENACGLRGSRKSTPCDDVPCDGTFTLADGTEVPVARDRCFNVGVEHCEMAEDMCDDHWVMQVRAPLRPIVVWKTRPGLTAWLGLGRATARRTRCRAACLRRGLTLTTAATCCRTSSVREKPTPLAHNNSADTSAVGLVSRLCRGDGRCVPALLPRRAGARRGRQRLCGRRPERAELRLRDGPGAAGHHLFGLR